jgi:hypothetical protein
MTLVAVPGCKPSGSEPAGSTSASGTVTAASSAGAPAEDPKTQKHVTKQDCEAWGEHAAPAFIASVNFASEQCPPPAREAVRKQFEDQIVSLQGSATAICMNHLGETYLAADAACLMKAADALTLRACHFAPMTNPDDTDWGLALKTIHDRCSVVPPGAGPTPRTPAPPPSGAAPAPPARAPAPKATPM